MNIKHANDKYLVKELQDTTRWIPDRALVLAGYQPMKHQQELLTAAYWARRCQEV